MSVVPPRTYQTLDDLSGLLPAPDRDALRALASPKLEAFVCHAAALGDPAGIRVITDAPEDLAWVRAFAVEAGEEQALAVAGHTIHYDGANDLARDPGGTKYLLPEGWDLGERLRSLPKEEGLTEIEGYLAGAMRGKTMLVLFFSLGPVGGSFSMPCAQITDSSYVAHSETLLYRPGYRAFQALEGSERFFRFLHSAGRLEGGVSAETGKRRVYIDLEEERVFSVNTQYAGNTVGLKKLAYRLAIRRARAEGWMAEHMFLTGVPGPQGRTTFFTGAYPSACGKTSTAMVRGNTILGDDLAYLRKIDGAVRAVNVEAGIFGIIEDVSQANDPVIWDLLTSPGEVIFSNVLLEEGTPRWLGDGQPPPIAGVNYQGAWRAGQKDAAGKPVRFAHKNARYTVSLRDLTNLDPRWDDSEGVEIGGLIYGGRDSDTSVPVEEAFDWTHGVVTKAASLESETTAAILGQQGVRRFDLMSTIDFLSIPIPEYVEHYLAFPRGLKRVPKVFGVNYFLRGKDGKYLNGMHDKGVWLRWTERRVHGEVQGMHAPSGTIPLYSDLRPLFEELLGVAYTFDQYVEQFTIRIPENLAKLARVEAIYRAEEGMPEAFFSVLGEQRQRYLALQAAKGDYVRPDEL